MRGRGLSFLVPALLSLSLLLTGCGQPPKPVSSAVSFTDDANHVIRLAKPAARIVSLGPSDTEILLALGLKGDLVGADKDSFLYLPAAYAAKLKGVPNVGDSVTSPNIEEIKTLHPDLVLAVYNAPYVKKLTSLGLKVAVLDPATVRGIEADIAKVGTATGDTAGAARLTATMRREIAAIAGAARKTGTTPRVFVELDPTLYTVGPGSFMDSLIRLAGGTNAMDGVVTTAYPQVSSEQVIAANPEVIVLQDQAYGGSAKAVSARPGWSAIAAVKDGRIVSSVDPSYFSEPGPAVVQGLLQLAQALHPGLKVPSVPTGN